LHLSRADEPGSISKDKTTYTQDIARPTPLQDDATLHDVAFIGTDTGWAVGDRGVVWKTIDGGATWSFLKTPVDCSLKSASFLSNRVGWVAGGGITPYTRLGYGIVLSTSDGGSTWKQLSTAPLPFIHYVRFFTMQEGVIAGTTDPAHPTGILITHDAGKTWEDVDGTSQPGWRAADFLRPDVGVAAGMRGATVQVDAKVLESRNGRIGLQNLHDVKLNPDNTGWPRQATRQSAPIEKIRFANDDAGWAVGAFGSILRTTDGGRNWTKSRGAERRAAIVSIHAHSSRVSFPLLATGVSCFCLHVATSDPTGSAHRTWILN
jgi:photosystem II stability/assembly factor-like uncharacterized protein